MPPLEPKVRGFFGALDDFQNRLSDKWRVHTNRRSLIALVVGGVIAIYAYIALIQPPGNFPIGELVLVPSGTSVSQIALELEAQGVIRSPLAFKALIMIFGDERNVRAGDYLFKEPKDIFAITRAMSTGAFGLEPIRIRVAEGATTKDMAIIFGTRLQRFNRENFLAQAQPMEGYLFPDTYFFLPNATEDTVIQTMRQNFDAHIATVQTDIDASGKPISEIITLASIIEREARNPEERRKISSVLWNRLNKDMALQVDVTFLYTIGKGTFELTKDDLASDSPYNTYINKGLPPTPIGSPSLDAIVAAAVPAKTDYLFFMADLRGVTHFCKTHSCHQANKLRYY